MKIPPSIVASRSRAVTLIEVLVVIGIIGILAALLFPVLGGIRKSSGEAKSLAVMKAVLQGSALYTADNNGQIHTLRWSNDPLVAPPYAQWVAGGYWGRLQPYLFGTARINNQNQLQTQINKELRQLFGTDPGTLSGSVFEGPRIYRDSSATPVPFAFNKYLHKYGDWVLMPRVPSPASTIYMTYGSALFDEEDGAIYTELPKNGDRPVNNIFYLPPDRTLAGFLDGRVEWISAPIDAKMIKFEGAE